MISLQLGVRYSREKKDYRTTKPNRLAGLKLHGEDSRERHPLTIPRGILRRMRGASFSTNLLLTRGSNSPQDPAKRAVFLTTLRIGHLSQRGQNATTCAAAMHHAFDWNGLLDAPRVRVKSRSPSGMSTSRLPTVKGAATTTETATSLMKPSSFNTFTALYSSASRSLLLAIRPASVVFPSIRPRTRTRAWGKGCDLCLWCSTPLPVLLKTEVLSKVLF